jgi:RecA/RadA recombinase
MDRDIKKALDSLNEIDVSAKYLNESFLGEDDWIDTGSLMLNALISGSTRKGIPKGRITQFVGASQTFKSGFILQLLASAQKQGMGVVLFDTEGGIDAVSAKRFGLDVDKVKYSNPKSIEQCRNGVKKILTYVEENKHLHGKIIIAIDSVANMLSTMEITRMDKDSESADMGTFAKSVKSLLKTCNIYSTITKCPIIMTNHIYDNPAQMFPSIEKDISGGRAAVFLPTTTVQLARKLVADDGGKTLDSKLAAGQKKYSGVVIRALTVKNRLIKQYLEGEMYLSFSTGLNKYYGLVELMKGLGVVEARGSVYYDWNDNKLGFAKNWSKDKILWEDTLIPEFEKRIQQEWSYGIDYVEEIPTEYEDEEEILDEVKKESVKVLLNEVNEASKSENPLDALKNLKKKVSDKLDQIEDKEE